MNKFIGLNQEELSPFDYMIGDDIKLGSAIHAHTEFDEKLYRQMFDESGSPLPQFYSMGDYYDPYFATESYGDINTFSDTTRGYKYEGLMSLAGQLSKAGYRVDDKGCVYNRNNQKVATYARKVNFWDRIAKIGSDDRNKIRRREKVDFPEPDEAIKVDKTEKIHLFEYKSMLEGESCAVNVFKCPYIVWRFRHIFEQHMYSKMDFKVVLSNRFSNCRNINSVLGYLRDNGCNVLLGTQYTLRDLGL